MVQQCPVKLHTTSATQPGTYYVVATDSVTGCTSVSDPLVFTPDLD